MMTLDSPAAPIAKDMARMYTQNTGVTVRIDTLPYDEVYRQLTALDKSTDLDIIRLDMTWMSRFASQIYEPLNMSEADVEALRQSFLPGLLQRYGSVDGTLYALPETPSAQMLFYRKDLFESIMLRQLFKEQYHKTLAPPRTFAEFNRIARLFTRRFSPESPVQYGCTVTLGNTGVAATEFLTRYFALTNTLFDAEDRLLLTHPAGVQALHELQEAWNLVAPAETGWWRDTAVAFTQGEVAMTVLYSNFASEIVGMHSQISDRIGYAMPPGNNPLLGGGSIGVCRYSRQKDLAWHFIKWLCSEKVSSAMTLMGSVSPCASAYDNYQIIDTYPWLSIARECFERSDIHRLPHGAAHFDERRFLHILGSQVLRALHGECGAEEALRSASRLYSQSIGAAL